MTSTLILIPIWAAWHPPLWFINGTVQYGSNFGIFVISVTVLSILLTALYFETNSIYICVIFHALINSFGVVIGNLETQSPSTDWITAWSKTNSMIRTNSKSEKSRFMFTYN